MAARGILLLLFLIQQCISQPSSNTTTDLETIKLGGLFYRNSAEYFAFLQAIDEVNSDERLLSGFLPNSGPIGQETPIQYKFEPVVSFHESSWIVEAASVLSHNPTAVIAPPYSTAVKQIAPLFSLTTTPLIGYSTTASILSDTDIYPYFYRVTSDVSDLIGPILGLFKKFTWTQAVLVHGSGPWGHGLDSLVMAGNLADISFPITIEIPDGATQSEIEELLSHDEIVLEYEVFVLHVTYDLRAAVFAAAKNLGLLEAGNAWLGTEDIARSTANESAMTVNYMEGVIAVRPKTPNTWESNRLRDDIVAAGIDMSYYAYLAYDAVLAVAHALTWRIDQGELVTNHLALPENEYFANITARSAHGEQLGDAITTLQLPPTWMMTGALYMSDNSRKQTYELVNFVNGSMEIVAEYTWNRKSVNQYFEGLLESLSVASRNTSGADVCISLDWTARASNLTQWNQLDKLFYVNNHALTEYYPEEYRANEDVIRFWETCLRPILGLDPAYTLTESSDDFDMLEWEFDVEDKAVTFIGNTTDIPVGALWKIGVPLKVLVWLVEPWGFVHFPNTSDDSNSTRTAVNVSGFLPTIWINVTQALGITSEFYYESGITAGDVIDKVADGEYDVALGAFTITEERTNLVNFIHQFSGGGLKILSKKPDPEDLNWMFLKPFDWTLWLACFATIVFAALMIFVLEWDHETFKDEENGGAWMPFAFIFLESVTISSSVLFGTHEPPKGIHTRVFVLVFQFVLLVWIAAYTANMASFLTKSSDPEPEIINFENLYVQGAKVAVVRGGYSAGVMETRSVNVSKFCDTTQECLDFVSSEPANDGDTNVFVFDSENVDFWARTSQNCQLVAPGDAFNSISFAFPTTFDLIPESVLADLNIEMIRLWSIGQITQWIEHYIEPLKEACDPYEIDEGSDTQSIVIDNMMQLFMFVGGFSICFCCILFSQPRIEKFCKSAQKVREIEQQQKQKQKQKENKRKDNDNDDNNNEDHKHMHQLINDDEGGATK